MKEAIVFLLVLSLLVVPFVPTVTVNAASGGYGSRFLEMYEKIKDPRNGYFDDEGIPYHAVETLIVEAPDYGHLSTSEAASYYAWLEAFYGKFTGDFSGLEEAWRVIDEYFVPSIQPGMNQYKPDLPAGYASEHPLPSDYPSSLENVPVGSDPIHQELYSAYSSYDMYGMHWLVDVDNWYSYGTGTDCTFINTFQRGEQESVWETVPHPSIEEFKFGGTQGFADLFIAGATVPKWSHTIASDADARMVQVMYWADKFAQEHGKDVSSLNAKAAKMGDYLRYAMFDKYFKKMGVQSKTGAGGTGYESAHYLMSWYYAWGGGLKGDWSWKIGSSHNHHFYQNVMTAYTLSSVPKFQPLSTNGARDWATSLERQLDFYIWLQSAEGPIAGGATNSWGGQYKAYPSGASTFYDMVYDWQPVYHDPSSNNWMGNQTWSIQRVAELYYETGNEKAKTILDKWVRWALDNSEAEPHTGTWSIVSNLEWSGQPDPWKGSRTENENLHAVVTHMGTDIGVSGSLANTLLFYAEGTKKHNGNLVQGKIAAQRAIDILDAIWNSCRDGIGVTKPEQRSDYSRFFTQKVYIPEGWTGKMANGDEIKPGVTFIDIRTKYRNDPMFAEVEDAYNNNRNPEFTYHRFWHAVDYTVALGVAEMFGYIVPPLPPLVYGDIDGNKSVNSMDFAFMRQKLLGMISEFPNRVNGLRAADVNVDGKFNSIDFAIMRLYLTGRIPSLPYTGDISI